MTATVAIVGRPNTGKSSLFNRIVGRREAIVDPTPGVTRDRIERQTTWNGRSFLLIDTGGVEVAKPEGLAKEISRQVEFAVKKADAVVFLTDAMDGLMPADRDFFDRLRSVSKPIFLAVNKADNQQSRQDAQEFYQLGVEDLYPVSAMHGAGVGDLLDSLLRVLPEEKPAKDFPGLKVAVLGRPNAGKSSFVNAVLRDERMIVDAKPGTTRDSVDVQVDLKGEPLTLIDTAGIRRRKKYTDAPDFYSETRSRRSVRRCDVVILVVDAMEGFTQQDRRIATMAEEEGKGMVFCLNKWDLVGRVDQKEFVKAFHRRLPFAAHVPLVSTSALKGSNVHRCLREAQAVHARAGKRVATGPFNDLLGDLQKRHPHPMVRGKRVRAMYGTQTGVHPQRFVLFAKGKMEASYLGYLRGKMREAFGLEGVPVRLHCRVQERKPRR